MIELDEENGANGCELDEFLSHRFLETIDETQTVQQMRNTCVRSVTSGRCERPLRVAVASGYCEWPLRAAERDRQVFFFSCTNS